MAITNINQNFLSPIEFQFSIHRLPYTQFFVQKVVAPGINMATTEQPNPFKIQHHSPDTLDYDDLSIGFKIDEHMQNYREIQNWMIALAFPNTFDEFSTIKSSEEGLYSDATLIILTSGKNPNLRYTFKDIFPVSLSGIPMDTTQPSMQPIEVDVTFKINSFTITTAV